MGTVLIHSGMPKTGSTSIQTWLRRTARSLAEEAGIQVVVDGLAPDRGSLVLKAFESGLVCVSNTFVMAMTLAARQPDVRAQQERLVEQLVEQLDAAARRHGAVLLTSESLHGFLVPPNEALLAGLEHLAGRHAVRIVYYVRPQDTALEARWRQWGFHQPASPSEWVRAEADLLRYAEALAALEAGAPSVSFEPRPFRPDLLDGGDVVADFAGWLGVAPPDQPIVDNPGMPLDLAILLRGAPPDVLAEATKVDGGLRQLRLGVVARTWGVAPSPVVERSRQVVRAFAHHELEPGNRELIARCGWQTECFVPPPPAGVEPDVGVLDELWEPADSPATLAYLHRAVASLLDSMAGSPRDG